jgi:hypothetical protein
MPDAIDSFERPCGMLLDQLVNQHVRDDTIIRTPHESRVGAESVRSLRAWAY